MNWAWMAISLLLSILPLGACSATGGDEGPGAMMQPGARPELSSDEAGLWMAMDKHEESLKTSGLIVKDEKLNGYVRRVLCRLTPDYCSEIRVYIVARPNFNASMAPNGAMLVWTGMLLRAENEAQLAFVLAHELAHYLSRHSLQRWRDARAKLDSLAFFHVAAMMAGSAAGIPVAGSATSLAAALVAQGSILGFSRDQEREADRLGLEMIVGAGYQAEEAPRIWELLIEEQEAGDDREPFFFFSTHPASEERMKSLRSQAQGLAKEDSLVGRDEFQAMLLPLRARLLRDELRRREFARTEVLLDRLINAGVRPAELHFFKGEFYRLRAEKGDADRAMEAYHRALAWGDPPAETYRSMGVVLQRVGDKAGARRAFEQYLVLRPDATDRAMVEFYISEHCCPN